jgi:hypothetical protein
MHLGRKLLASGVLFAVALVWNGLVHGLLLRETAKALDGLRRPEGPNLGLALLLTAGVALVFVWSYARCARRGGWREGLAHGLFFAVLAGLLVNLNQYILFPIPGKAALTWWLFGVGEFCLYGLIASWLVRVGPRAEGADGIEG